MQKKKIILLTTLVIIIIGIIALALSKPKQVIPIGQTATAEYSTKIGQTEYDITNLVLAPSEIMPTISAGMIPVKYENGFWTITTKEDRDWYSYSNGKPAYIMLNDGYYKSELERGVEDKQLMQNSVGASIARPEDLGTIYMYIPRFAYNEDGEILYIKQGCSVAGNYTIPEIFTHKTETLEASLRGIWVEYDTVSDVGTKVSNMTGQSNKYGFIANTIGVNANSEATYVTTIKTYIAYLQNPQSDSADSSLKQGSQDSDDLPPLDKGGGTIVPEGYITNSASTNRTILKITNSSKLEPIMANAKYDENIEKVKIEVTYSTNNISKIIDSTGKILSENSTTADTGDEVIGNKVYTYTVIDNLGNQKQVSVSVSGLDVYIIENETDLKFFRNAVNAGKTTAKTKAYQIADVTMNEGKFTTDLEKGTITTTGSIETWTPIGNTINNRYAREILWK